MSHHLEVGGLAGAKSGRLSGDYARGHQINGMWNGLGRLAFRRVILMAERDFPHGILYDTFFFCIVLVTRRHRSYGPGHLGKRSPEGT